MSDQYLGEIRTFSGNYAPEDWAMCNGQLLQISQYAALFGLIGTTYGGDGKTTFAVPDLRGRLGVHMGTNAGINYPLGASAGSEEVTVTEAQMPAHTHPVNASNVAGTAATPAGTSWAVSTLSQYSTNNSSVQMSPSSLSSVGGSQPHNNMMPFLTVTFIIALQGIFPQRPS